MGQADAFEALKRGEIAATILIAGKPAASMAKLRTAEGFKLLPVPYAKPIRYGITSDGSRINAYGVPAITYGPGFGTHLVDPTETKAPAEWDTPTGVRRGVGIENMVNCTKVYAMAALDVCNKKRAEVAKS